MIVEIRVGGLDVARRRVRGIRGVVFSATKRAYLKEARRVQSLARTRAPKDTGELRNGIKVESRGGVTYGFAEVGVVSTAPHAAFVELGTGARGARRARQAPPPGYHYNTQKPGMFPQPHLLPAWNQRAPFVERTVVREVNSALRSLENR